MEVKPVLERLSILNIPPKTDDTKYNISNMNRELSGIFRELWYAVEIERMNNTEMKKLKYLRKLKEIWTLAIFFSTLRVKGAI